MRIKVTILLQSWAKKFMCLAFAVFLPTIALHSRADGSSNGAKEPALSAEEIRAIVVEARRRARQEDPPGGPWQSLDQNKLARLLLMPEFAQLDNSEKATLVDQAGAWDLMPFEKPSEAQAMWARWYPERGIDKQVGEDDHSVSAPRVFYADQYWGKEAGAMIALMNCMPSPVWYVRDQEPMLWAINNGSTWDQPNVFNFGECVRTQSEQGQSPFVSSPHTQRGLVSAEILERKISNYLLKYRCTGKGPDSCLPLLHALESLNSQHEQLSEILKRLEPEFGLNEAIVIPATLQDRRGNLNDIESQQILAIREQAVKQAIFLTAKLPSILHASERWPTKETEVALRRILELSILMRRTDLMQERPRYTLAFRYAFSNPWWSLPTSDKLSPEFSSIFFRFGREYAHPTGCDPILLDINELPAAFWIGFSEEKLRAEQTSCDTLTKRVDLAKIYGLATKQPTSKLLKPLSGFRQFLSQLGPARDEVLKAISPACEATLKKQSDPWRACAQLRHKRHGISLSKSR